MVYEITSGKTGQNYRVSFDQPPSEADVDEATNYFDTQAAQAAGVDPRVLNQGPLGTIATKVRDVGPAVVGGLMETGGSLLDAAAQGVGRLTGTTPGGMFQNIADTGAELQATGQKLRPTNPFNTTANTIGSGVQQALGMVATMGAAAPVVGGKAALATVPLVMGGIQGGGQGVMTARDMGITNPAGQLALGGAFAGAEILSEKLGGIGSKGLTDAVQAGLAGTLKQSAKTLGSEAIEEPISGAAQDIATRVAGTAVADPNRPGFTTTGFELPKLDAAMLERRKQEAIGGAAGGTIFAGLQLTQPRPNAPLPPNQTTTPSPTPAGASPAAQVGVQPAQAVSPLIGIAQRAGAVDPLLPESTGDLTAEDVAALETANLPPAPAPTLPPSQSQAQAQTQGVGVGGREGLPETLPPANLNEAQTITGSNVQMGSEMPVPPPTAAAGAGAGAQVRSPEAQAYAEAVAQAAEESRLAQVAKLRARENQVGRGPVIPDSPLGVYDILDFVNENKIRVPRADSAERKAGEYDWTETYSVPQYYRKFLGSSDRGGSIDQVAQQAFENGFIREPSADALMGAIQQTIDTRKQYKVQFAQRAKEQAVVEKQTLDFEKTQQTLRRKDKERVFFEDITPGDEMTIDGEQAVVKNIEYTEDGYLTNVVIEDGKRFGLMQFDPQTRSGLFVDEYTPKQRPGASSSITPATSSAGPAAAAPTQTSAAEAEGDSAAASSGFTHTIIQRDLDSGFMTTAGADALLDLAHRAFAAGQTFVQWSKTMLQRFGESIRQWLAGVWDHAKRSSQTGAVNFTGRLGGDLQKAGQALKPKPASNVASKSGAAQPTEPSLGGLSEAEVSWKRRVVDGLVVPAVPSTWTFISSEKAKTGSKYFEFETSNGRRVKVSIRDHPSSSFRAQEFGPNTIEGRTIDEVEGKLRRFQDKPIPATKIHISKLNPPLAVLNLMAGDGMVTPEQARIINDIFPKIATGYFARDKDGNKQRHTEATNQSLADKISAAIKNPAEYWTSAHATSATAGSGMISGAKETPASSPAVNPESSRAAGGTSNLQSAYMAAMQGRSSAMVPIADVYAQAKQQNPNLTPQQFLTEVQAGDTAGTVLLEPFDTPQGLQAAGPFVVRNSSGVPSINMMVQRGFTHLDVSGLASQRGAVQIDSRTVRSAGAPNETQARFASPNPADRAINGPRTDEQVAAEAQDWLNGLDTETAIESYVQQAVPLPLDAAEHAAGLLLSRLSDQATNGKTEVLRMWAHVQGQRMARIWTREFLSADPARGLRQRGVVNNTILAPIAPILAAQDLLVERATKVIDARFDGGAEGVTEKVKAVVKKADTQAGETLAGQLNDATSTGNDPRIADLEARLKELRTQMTAGDAAMQQTTSTWQKIMNLLNAASARKSSMLNGARSKLSSLREAAQQRKAQRRAEGRLNANPVEDFADDVIIGAAFISEGIVEFANWSQAMIREIGARSSTELKELYAAASQQYHDALAEQQKRPSATISRDSPALARLLDRLRKKLYPGMKWADIFTALPETQKERQLAIYQRLMGDAKLKDLTPEERLKLTNELDKAWMRERTKVFNREMEKMGILGEKKPKDREKVKAAAPRLLRLMNLGMLNSEMFREALAKEYGLNMIDAGTAAELRAIGEKIQTAPEGLPRRKLEQQLVERLQNLAGTTFWQVMDSWWTASVLSGWRTQVDIGLSLANGIEDVGLGSIVTALRTGEKDVAIRGLANLFGRIPSAFMEAVDHLRTGNKALMRNFELEAKQALEGGNRMASDVGAQMWRDGGWRKVPGGFMIFYGRLMTALDHVNSASTREGAKAMALARHPELYQKALRISDVDRQAARQQARLELTGGAMPATQQERLEESARVREILDKDIPTEVMDEATNIGRAAALQGEPSGLGGFLLDAVNAAVGVVARKAEAMGKRPGLDPKSQQMLKLLQGTAPLARAITGTKFARTVSHALNRTLSYVPAVGAYAVGQQGRTGAFGDVLAAKQVIGTLVGIALYLAFDDDDDEKGIEDGWKDKTPQQKTQLYAQGKQPFTVWQRDAQGRVRSWNYQQWGVAGIVNTVAAMLKQKGSEQGAVNVLMSSLVQGAMSFTDKAQLQGLQTVFGETSRSTDPASGIAANLNKWAAQTVGGLVPRLVKDLDMVASPELRSSTDWWQKWTKEVPMLRQLTSGKRIDILGGDIKLDRGPLSRVTGLGTGDPVYRLLARLNEKDLWLPDPSSGVRIVKLSDGTRRKMTDTEKDRFQRLTGQMYRDFLTEHGQRLLQTEQEAAKKEISRITDHLRERAAYQATH